MDGNATSLRFTESSLDIGNIVAASILDVTISAPGVVANSTAIAAPRAALEAGIGIVGCRTATDQIIMRVMNCTAGAVNPAAVAFDFLVFPPVGSSAAI
jgi:hypothetical protein